MPVLDPFVSSHISDPAMSEAWEYDDEPDPYEAYRWSDADWAAWYDGMPEPRPSEEPPKTITVDPGTYL